ncbi:hypothetical protein ACN2XU_17515 [Primorskyibacter sp. 2E107]|uniref:hypothetical protein n=1 Tax=Primorskyibacter sp. 2E107 TaxID=3403458 RepID=UPI003AF81AA2
MASLDITHPALPQTALSRGDLTALATAAALLIGLGLTALMAPPAPASPDWHGNSGSAQRLQREQ